MQREPMKEFKDYVSDDEEVKKVGKDDDSSSDSMESDPESSSGPSSKHSQNSGRIPTLAGLLNKKSNKVEPIKLPPIHTQMTRYLLQHSPIES